MPMPTPRRAVLKRLAATSDAERRETTTIGDIATGIGAQEREVAAHVAALADCALARTYPDGRVRVTITGAELLELDTDDVVIVDLRDAGSDH